MSEILKVNTVAAIGFLKQKVAREFICKLSQNNVKAIRQNGLYAFVAIKSICTSFSLHGPDKPSVNAKISVFKLKRLLKVKTYKDLAKLLCMLSDMGLIEWEYNDYYKEIRITDLTLTIEECRREYSPVMREQQKGAIKKGVGFFFVDKSIQDKFADKNRFSEADIATDLWLSAVYQDDTIKLSQDCPITAFADTNNLHAEDAIITHSYDLLAQRYNCSVSRIHDVMQRLQHRGFVELRSYQNIGTYIFIPIFVKLLHKCIVATPDKKSFKSIATILSNSIKRIFIKVRSQLNIEKYEHIPFPTDIDAPPEYNLSDLNSIGQADYMMT